MRTLEPVLGHRATGNRESARDSYRRVESIHHALLRGKVIHPSALVDFRSIHYELSRKAFGEIIEKCPLSLEDWGTVLGIDDFPKVVNKITRFPTLHTEKIFETLLLCNLGKKVYGNEEDFKRWLNQQPIPYFGDRSPRELLGYSSGFNELRKALQMIDYGQTA